MLVLANPFINSFSPYYIHIAIFICICIAIYTSLWCMHVRHVRDYKLMLHAASFWSTIPLALRERGAVEGWSAVRHFLQ